MVHRRYARNKRVLLLWTLLIAAVSATVLVLAAYARMSMHAPERARIETLIAEARERTQQCAEDVRLAREKLPPDAGIPQDWNARRCVEQWLFRERWKYLLALGLIANPHSIGYHTISDVVRPPSNRPQLPPCLQSADPDKDLPAEACADVRRFFRELPELQDMEKGFAHGLCGDLCSGRGVHMPCVVAPFAARAVCEAIDGETQKALDTSFLAYRLARLAARTPGVWGYGNACAANAVIDRAVWQIVDAADLSRTDWDRLVAEIDQRRSSQSLVYACRVAGACREAGYTTQLTKRDERLYTKGEVLLSSGAMQIAEEFIQKLERPPYECGMTHQDLREIQKRVGRFSLPLVDFRAECMHACISHLEDLTRADAAHLAFALKAWKKTHGTYPATLQALDPPPAEADLRDPDTGKGVTYELNETGGFRVYAGDPSQGMLWNARN